jgi:hypothetical protein
MAFFPNTAPQPAVLLLTGANGCRIALGKSA